MKEKILYLLLLSCILTNCSKDNIDSSEIVKDNILLENNDKLTLNQESCSMRIYFTSSGNWEAIVDAKASSWCGLNSSHGVAGSNSIIISVSENTTYDERNASITISTGTAKEVITITQKQKDALIVSSNKVELATSGGEFSIDIQTNVDISYEIEESTKKWISIVETRALSNKSLRFIAKPNDTTERRQGCITLTGSNGLTEIVTIYQEGEEPCLVLTSNDSLMIDSKGGTVKIELRSNIEYEMIIPNADWIKEATTRSVSTYTHYLDIAPNTDYEFREAVLIVKSKNGLISDSLNILQMQRDAILIARDSYNITSDENYLELKINSNVKFETETSVDWISIYDDKTTRALVENKLSLKIEENLSETERIGVVSLKYEDVEQKISICQDGRTDKMKIVLVHSENEFLPLAFQGNNISGTVDWGDGTKSDIDQGHVFTDIGNKVSTFEVMGVEAFHIEKLNTISSIVIYCNEGKDGITEDFNIENKEWD